MIKEDLRKVQVIKHVDNNPFKEKISYTGYFHEFSTQREYGDTYQVVIVEDEAGCLNSEYIKNVKFID